MYECNRSENQLFTSVAASMILFSRESVVTASHEPPVQVLLERCSDGIAMRQYKINTKQGRTKQKVVLPAQSIYLVYYY